uniref:TNFR-Cys domain-containing protein n=1 Tax=Esox lucius TaxID=8010 RepID=A0A6Q2WZ80_ESOLU
MLFSATVSSVTMFLAILFRFHNVDLSAACGPTEYRIGCECCPMCSPGNRVNKHCTEYTSTSCVPCIGSTYLDEPNGLTACTPCTHCDPGFGLRVKHPCRPSSDTVCEPLEGFYCTDPTVDGCKSAQRHSRCKPGQYIRQNGTTSKDTVCVDCTGDTYSDGSFTSCQPHKM